MSCPDENDILGFLDGDTSSEGAEAFEAHVAGCGDCQALISELGRSLDVATGHWLARSGGDVVGPGSQVGKYQVIERIGEGAMGIVYRARDPELDRDVALKLVRVIGLGPDEAERARSRLLKEAVAMARLAEPNVVAVYDASVVGDAVFVAMELVDGLDLAGWLEAAPRTWREIVRVFIDAGRGLAAAHAAGIVHRDFKPANVLIGPGTRARVTDFGLAAIDGGPRLAAGSQEVKTVPVGAEDVTRSGTVMGTPAYMSPEARAGGGTDERSDQYSVAMSLAEALSGTRPVAGAPVSGVAPRRIATILERALETDPAARYRSMTALVDALERASRPTSRRSALLGALAAGAVAIGGIGFYATHRDEHAPCTAGPERVAAIWNPAVADAAGAAFTATKIAYAPTVFTSARANLDRFADRWRAGYVEACEATRVHGEQSEALLDLRMRCLEDELRRFRTATEVLAAPTPAIVARAISISALDDGLARCSDAAALTRETPRPVGPTADAEIERISNEYDRIRKLGLEGKQAEAYAATRALALAAEAVGYDRMEAEIVGHLGELHWRAGDLDAAVDTLYRAVAAAERARSDDIRAGIMLVLVAVIGFEQARHAEALQIARLAEIALEASGDTSRLAKLISNRGSIHFGRGDYAAAADDYQRARALMLEVHGPDDPRTGQIINNVALIEEQDNKHREAAETYGQALAVYEKSLGPAHPQVALTLANRATSLANAGDVAAGLADLARALRIRRETLGDDHPAVGDTYRVMAQFANASGDAASALDNARRALVIITAHREPPHPDIAATRAVIGESLLKLGRPGDAQKELEAAIAGWDALEVASPLKSMSRYNLAMAIWDGGGDRQKARSLAILARDELADDPEPVGRIDKWLESHR